MMSVVIIPAYRPDETLAQLAGRLWLYGCRIVVVDDGSGEAYRSIFSEIGELCTVLRHSKNRGKGAAIKTALSYIRENLPDCDVIGIMDADGQHLPEDMMRLIKWAFERKNTLMLGVRAVGSRMPLRSRLGNRITRRAFGYKEVYFSIRRYSPVQGLCRLFLFIGFFLLHLRVSRQMDFPHEVKDNIYFLKTLAVYLLRRMDNDFLYKLIDDSRR